MTAIKRKFKSRYFRNQIFWNLRIFFSIKIRKQYRNLDYKQNFCIVAEFIYNVSIHGFTRNVQKCHGIFLNNKNITSRAIYNNWPSKISASDETMAYIVDQKCLTQVTATLNKICRQMSNNNIVHMFLIILVKCSNSDSSLSGSALIVGGKCKVEIWWKFW